MSEPITIEEVRRKKLNCADWLIPEAEVSLMELAISQAETIRLQGEELDRWRKVFGAQLPLCAYRLMRGIWWSSAG